MTVLSNVIKAITASAINGCSHIDFDPKG